MKRIFIPLKKIQIYDEMHELQPDGSFVVDEKKDGKTTEEHIQGIEYIKGIIKEGQKTLPVLVYEDSYGDYIRLDGFKRCLAYQQLGYENIEAFVCTEDEYRNAEWLEYEGAEHDNRMRACKGGQPHERFKLLEGGEMDKFNYDKVKFLYKDDNKPHGLRIELAECIHVHWNKYGRYRLALGERDFLELAKAITAYGQN